jgi:hypothetical protein
MSTSDPLLAVIVPYQNFRINFLTIIYIFLHPWLCTNTQFVAASNCFVIQRVCSADWDYSKRTRQLNKLGVMKLITQCLNLVTNSHTYLDRMTSANPILQYKVFNNIVAQDTKTRY